MSTMKTILLALFFVILTAGSSPAVKAKYYSRTHMVNVPATMKQTHLRFFQHETISGVNPSAVVVAKPNNTVVQQGSVLPFGAVYVIDDPLTEAQDPNSTVIGSARGMFASTSRGSDVTILVNSDLLFTSSKFNGSSIVVVCRDSLALVKELAIVGGKGKFRMAKGFSENRAVFFDATKGIGIIEWRVTVFHP